MAKKAMAAVVVGMAAVAVAVTVGMAAPAAARTGGQAVGQASSSADRPAYCDRVDKALERRQRLVARIEGDADTRGSIAWLNERAAAASAAGNADVATLFTDRAALRNQVLDPLKTVIIDLTAVQQAHCS